MSSTQTFDVIVVGGGHAGTEAALAAARMGAKTLLLTQNIETVGQMSCNPAIGGIGKSHLVKEIDAMGGVMAQAADRGGIQFRTLNRRKGPAVRATRAQADRALYKSAIRGYVEQQPNLALFQQEVDDLIVESETVTGVITRAGQRFQARAVVLTVGTFLGGKIHIGDQQHQGGRAGDAPSNRLAERLRELPFEVGRLKTGTPPRIDGKTVDFTKLQIQPGDEPRPIFSFIGKHSDHPAQIPCHIAYTNEKTHDIIRQSLDQSAMYSGAIEGVGPRYCPSIEDKITRFADRDRHQVFVEPEGLNTQELYPNGISTSLPYQVQLEMVRSIKGMESAHITRAGYAIEYDYFDPRGLSLHLETKCLANLFFAGQINGTTGYEEAAAQGLLAGINAARRAQNESPWHLRRDQAYIGVLVDDLITRGTNEPYRMFTSRAEYRLLLREDNADIRLTAEARALGLVDDTRWQRFETKRERIEQERARLEKTFVQPDRVDPDLQTALFGKTLEREHSLADLLRRPEVDYNALRQLTDLGPYIDDAEVCEQLEIQAKYAGYVNRQQVEIERGQRYEQTIIPGGFDYSNISGLSNEIKQKLSGVQPETLGQAARISGVTPAAISLLLVHLRANATLSKSA